MILDNVFAWMDVYIQLLMCTCIYLHKILYYAHNNIYIMHEERKQNKAIHILSILGILHCLKFIDHCNHD